MDTQELTFERMMTQSGRTRRFVIAPFMGGWEVREEEDDRVVRQAILSDWHRVERAQRVFSLRVSELERNGWKAS